MSDTETSDITDATPDTDTDADTATGATAAGEGVEPTVLDDAPATDTDAPATDTDAPATETDATPGEPGGDGDVSVEAPDADAQEAEAQDAVSEDELLAPPVVDNPWTRPGRWFVVHTQSGYEKKVKQNLEARIHSMNAEEAVYEVVIPMEDYVDFKNGKRVVNQRKMFPGYLLVRAELDDTAWFVIRNTPGVTGFVGQGAKPSPLPRRDVESFLMPKGGEEQVATRAKPRLEYELGETVRVKEGPFADFSGEVIELNEDQLKLKVLVNIFGRETPVELEFSKVAKL
jgi:transcriptional antiterminator NusG